MYQISKWYLTIKATSNVQFFELYDKAVQEIADTAFNKKWYRSPARTFSGWDNGLRVYLIPLNNPTLKKVLTN